MAEPRVGNIVTQDSESEHIGPDYTGDNISAKKVANYVWNSSTLQWERESSSGGSSSSGTTAADQENQIAILEEIRVVLQSLAAAKGIAADIRVTLLGGTTAVTGSLTGVTTVTTLTNMAQIGGINATPVAQNIGNQTAIQSNINNVIVS